MRSAPFTDKVDGRKGPRGLLNDKVGRQLFYVGLGEPQVQGDVRQLDAPGLFGFREEVGVHRFHGVHAGDPLEAVPNQAGLGRIAL